MKKPAVSILIPTYNRRVMLNRAVSTALGQSHEEVRIVIFDDGSTDETERNFHRRKDSRVRYVKHNKNAGVGVARNALLDLCSTEYACWLDSDDLCNMYRVETMLWAIQKWSAPFVRSGFEVYNEEKPNRWKDRPAHAYPKRHTVATSLFRTKCAPRFDLGMDFGEDLIWESKLVLAHGTGIYVPFDLYLVDRTRKRGDDMAPRLSAGRHRLKRLRRTEHSDAMRERLKTKVWSLLEAKSINSRCRVEYVPPAHLRLPFDFGNPASELPAILQRANCFTSQRTGKKRKPRFAECSKCGVIRKATSKFVAPRVRVYRCPKCGWEMQINETRRPE